MNSRAGALGGTLLWETAGLRCLLVRRPAQPSFEVTIQHGSEVLKRLAFEREEDTVAFALGEKRAAMLSAEHDLATQLSDSPGTGGG
jgi:hypothetical protein